MSRQVQTDAAGRFRLEAFNGIVYNLAATLYGKAPNTTVYSAAPRLLVTTDVRDQKLVLSQFTAPEVCPPPEPVVPSADSLPPGVSVGDALIAQARERLEKSELIEPRGLSARDSLGQLRKLAPDHPELKNLARELCDELLEKGGQALRARAYERSAQLLRAAREMGAGCNEAALTQVEAELKTARERTGL